MNFRYKLLLLLFPLLVFGGMLHAEDGSRLWLRFSDVAADKSLFSGIVGDQSTLALKEFQRAWQEMTGAKLLSQKQPAQRSLAFVGTGNVWLKQVGLAAEMKTLGDEGYLIRTISMHGKSITLVAANTDAGRLYGAFHLLRLLQNQAFSDTVRVTEKPSYQWRLLNHWDNPDGTVERGYAGHSIWKWNELPEKVSPRYQEYARANASIGINATVLNNVNASPRMLTTEYLQKVKTIAAVLRPYHIRVFLSINFSSPKAIGGLPTADPLDKDVIKWWQAKAAEIYRLIPDFGGFLVKANSEGLPGPMDYGRTHVDGANMLADALKPYHGLVMWRAFVYEPGDDRVKLAYNEFHTYDGQFRDNVIIQVKNGPVDFQPREPFSPLFGAMQKTPLMPEFQITQEYLGQGNHLVFLAPMWREFFDSDTYCKGAGSSIAQLTVGKIYPQTTTAIAGVANIGEDANWCGHDFAQANWYAFGRLAWNNQLSSEQIATEWVKMTWGLRAKNQEPRTKSQEPRTKSQEPRTKTKDQRLPTTDYQLPTTNNGLETKEIVHLMLRSREAAVSYMMPLGLHHLFAWGHHYGPEPWCEVAGARPDWLPKYYHRADSIGLGADRTTSGSNAVAQYFSPLREQYNDLQTCPEKYLLWFHHVPWNHRMQSGRTLWDELCYTYDQGVQQVRNYQQVWEMTQPFVDVQRFREVQAKLCIQAQDAVWWKDACLLYFQTFSHQPFPQYIAPPVHDLDSLKRIKLDMKHHN